MNVLPNNRRVAVSDIPRPKPALTNREAFDKILARRGAQPLKPSAPRRRITPREALLAVSAVTSVAATVTMITAFALAKKYRKSQDETDRAKAKSTSDAGFKAMPVAIVAFVLCLLVKP